MKGTKSKERGGKGQSVVAWLTGRLAAVARTRRQ